MTFKPALTGGFFYGEFEVSRVGRPGKYSAALARDICARIAAGETVTAICAGDDMPAPPTIYRWLREHESFRALYKQAREDQADTLADQILDVVTSMTGTDNATAARVKIQTMTWLAGKRNPRVYGDKMTPPGAVTVNHAASLNQAIARKKAALAAAAVTTDADAAATADKDK